MPDLFPVETALTSCQKWLDDIVKTENLAWANVLSVDPIGQRLILLAVSHNCLEKIHQRVVHRDMSLAGVAVERRDHDWMLDVSTDKRRDRHFIDTELIPLLKIKSLCTIPVLNSFNKHQALLVVNFFPNNSDALTKDDRENLTKKWKELSAGFGRCFERCLDEECHRAANRLNATLGKQSETPSLKSICRTIARVAKDRLGCDFVAVFTQVPPSDLQLLQGWADDVQPFVPYFSAIEGLAQEVSLSNRERLILDELDAPQYREQLVSTNGKRRLSILLVPIRSTRGTPVGVIAALNMSADPEKEAIPLSYEQVAVLEAMGQTFAPRVELMFSEGRKEKAMSRLAHEMRIPVSAFRAAISCIEGELRVKPYEFKYPYLEDLKIMCELCNGTSAISKSFAARSTV